MKTSLSIVLLALAALVAVIGFACNNKSEGVVNTRCGSYDTLEAHDSLVVVIRNSGGMWDWDSTRVDSDTLSIQACIKGWYDSGQMSELQTYLDASTLDFIRANEDTLYADIIPKRIADANNPDYKVSMTVHLPRALAVTWISNVW